MKLPRRNFLHLAAGTAALPTASRFAWAQAYPSRLVHLIAPFAPGGAFAWRSTLFSCPIAPNWVRSSSGCVTDDCGRTSATSRLSTTPSPLSIRPSGSAGRRSSAFVREQHAPIDARGRPALSRSAGYALWPLALDVERAFPPCDISTKETNDRGDNSHEGNRGNGSGCGNGRDEAGRAARAAGSDKRRHRSDSCVGIRPD